MKIFFTAFLQVSLVAINTLLIMKHLSMQELEDLGFELIKSYTHDEFITQTRSKENIFVYTTWDKEGEFIRQDLTIIGDVRLLKIKPEDLKQLDKILNKN